MVDELGFQRCKEALHDSVVPAVAATAHRAFDAVGIEQAPVVGRRVLTAAVRVMHQQLGPRPVGQSHTQGVQREFPGDAIRHRPSDHPARVQVEHHRQVQPATARPHVGHVGCPLAVLGIGGEVALQHVGCHRVAMLRVGGHPVAAPALGAKALLAHQTRYAVAPDCHPVVDQVAVHPRAAVGPTRRRVARLDVDQQAPVLACARALTTPTRGVEAASRDLEQPAHHGHGKSGLLRLDEREPHIDSLAKKAVAFLRNYLGAFLKDIPQRRRPSAKILHHPLTIALFIVRSAGILVLLSVAQRVV